MLKNNIWQWLQIQSVVRPSLSDTGLPLPRFRDGTGLQQLRYRVQRQMRYIIMYPLRESMFSNLPLGPPGEQSRPPGKAAIKIRNHNLSYIGGSL